MVFTKNNIFTKKLASQNNSSENGNESISVTSHFFTIFSRLFSEIVKWTFINVQNRKTNTK